MFNRTNPDIVSQEIKFTSTDDKVFLNMTSKQLVEIWKGGSDEPESTVALDQESRQYLHVTLKQITYDYTSKEE